MLNSDKELNCFLQMTINLMSTFVTPLLSLLPVCFSLLQIEPDMTNTISYCFQSPPSIQNLLNCFSIRKSLWVVAIGNHRPLLEDTSEIHQDIQSPCRHRGGQKRLKNVSERACDTLLMEWKLDGALTSAGHQSTSAWGLLHWPLLLLGGEGQVHTLNIQEVRPQVPACYLERGELLIHNQCVLHSGFVLV